MNDSSRQPRRWSERSRAALVVLAIVGAVALAASLMIHYPLGAEFSSAALLSLAVAVAIGARRSVAYGSL